MSKGNWEIDLDAFYYPDHDTDLVYIVRALYPENLPLFWERRLVHINELDNYVTEGL